MSERPETPQASGPAFTPEGPRYTPAPEALARLNALLPLAARQAALAPGLRALHRGVLRALAVLGHAPDAAELSEMAPGVDPRAALAELRALDLVVTDEQGAILGAYPVTLEDTPHRISLGGHTLHAMCSVDALAFSPLFGLPTDIDSRCHETGAPIHVEQDGMRVLASGPCRDVHVGVRWQPPGTCAAHSLCREMVFFCDAGAAARWQANDASRSVLTLPEAVRLAADFFVPLLGEPA